MNLEEQFPYRVYLNLARRQDRRFAVQGELERAGIGGVERFAAVDGKRMGSPRGFGSKGYYALAVTNRMVLRRAALRGAEAVLMFEDDVILHPRFQELVAQIELPEDWEMFFFGCKHVAPPEPAGRGLVRVRKAWDWHAVAFRERAYLKVRRALAGLGAPSVPAAAGWHGGAGGTRGAPRLLPSNDQRVGELQGEGLVTYAAWPNLAWQRVNASDLVMGTYSAYGPDGEQAVEREAIEGLTERMVAAYGPGGGLRWPEAGNERGGKRHPRAMAGSMTNCEPEQQTAKR
jgi:hypothetical protein